MLLDEFVVVRDDAQQIALQRIGWQCLRVYTD